MSGVVLFGNLDVAELVFYIFFAFFVGLVIWLRREDRREGYPLEEDLGGRLIPNDGLLQMAMPKTFHLPHGLGKVRAPETSPRDPVDVPNSRRTSAYDGMPIEPVGNPLASGIGPASYAQRADRPDLNWEGKPRIVPMSALPEFTVCSRDPDIRGYRIAGADGVVAGTVSDLWVDRAEILIRYLHVTLSGGGVAVVPMMMCKVDKARQAVICDAVNGSQFAGSPVPKTAGQITLLEEEKIVGWFGGGYLYANAERAEPLL